MLVSSPLNLNIVIDAFIPRIKLGLVWICFRCSSLLKSFVVVAVDYSSSFFVFPFHFVHSQH